MFPIVVASVEVDDALPVSSVGASVASDELYQCPCDRFTARAAGAVSGMSLFGLPVEGPRVPLMFAPSFLHQKPTRRHTDKGQFHT